MEQIAQPVGHCQIGTHLPGVLGVEFELVVVEVALFAGPVGKRGAGLVVVEIGGHARITAEEEGEEIIVACNGGRIRIDVGRPQRWIERVNEAAQTNTDEIKIVFERADLPDEFEVSSEIHSVLAFDPGQTLAEFRNWDVAGLRSRSEEGV